MSTTTTTSLACACGYANPTSAVVCAGCGRLLGTTDHGTGGGSPTGGAPFDPVEGAPAGGARAAEPPFGRWAGGGRPRTGGVGPLAGLLHWRWGRALVIVVGLAAMTQGLAMLSPPFAAALHRIVGTAAPGSAGTGASGGAAGAAAPDLTAGSGGGTAGWVRWQGGGMSALLPDSSWQVAASSTGLEITSPTGDAVSYGFTQGSYSLDQARTLTETGMASAGVVGLTVTGQTPSTTLADGDQAVAESFQGTRAGVPVTGLLEAEVGPDRLAGYAVLAPSARWSADAAELVGIKSHITGPIG